MLKEKRERVTTSTDVSKVDRISVLPKDVLGLILSLLTSKEATATSILCRSWRYLWVLSSKTMNFDGTQSLRKFNRFMKNFGFTNPSLNKACIEPLEEERRKFVRWVDRVIVLNQCLDHRSNLEEFKVYFDLIQTHREWIDDWLSYAFSRKVERLELSLTCEAWGSDRFHRDSHLCYEFPYKKGNLPNNFQVLKKLCLHLVSVSGEVVQLFLEKCPLLEQVSVSGSQALLSLEIVATFPSFKCLEISLCHKLKSVVLRDSNVVTIKYSGKIIPFVLVNVPLLTQLWIKSLVPGPGRLKDVVGMFLPVLPQLEMLKIYPSLIYWKESKEFVSAIEMCNLKQLVVNIGYYYRDMDSLLSFVNLINAAPCLQRFVVEAVHQDSKKDKSLHGACARNYTPRARVNVPVKEVEFVGYRGVFNHLELIMHFVEKDVALTNIIIDPRSFKYHLHRPWDRIYRHKVEDEVFARAYAKEQVKEHVPSRINVKIL